MADPERFLETTLGFPMALADAINSVFAANTIGLVPSPGTPSGLFLKDDGTFGTPTPASGTITNAMLADMAQSTIKGRSAGSGTGSPEDLTATQATAILDAFIGDSGSGGTKGLVPAPASASATRVLYASGIFDNLPGSVVTVVESGALSSQATLDILLGISDLYEIDLIAVSPVTDNASLIMRFSQSGSFLSGASDYAWAQQDTGVGVNDEADSEIQISGPVGKNTAENATFKIRIYRPGASSFYKTALFEGYYRNGTPKMNDLTGGGQLIANTNAIDGVRFLFTSGSISSGYYAVRSYSFT